MKKRKILMATLIPLAVVAVFLTVFCSVVLQSVKIRTGVGDIESSHMSQLAIEGIVEANPRIVDIAMIGAHGATSSTIDPHGKINPKDADQALGKLNPLIRGAAYRFAKAQTVDVTGQLKAGARYFQVKCCYYDGGWWGEHSLIAEPFDTYIREFIRFLSSTTGEVLLLQIEPTYIGDKTSGDLNDYIASIEEGGKTLMDFVYYGEVNSKNTADSDGVRIGELRYNDVTLSGASSGVILTEDLTVEGVPLKEGPGAFNDYFFDIDHNAISEWHSRIGSKRLIKLIDKEAKRIRDNWDRFKNYLRINQTQGSFSARDIFSMIDGWSLIDFANKHNPKVVGDSRFEEWLEVMPIALFDYVTCANDDFVNKVNKKIYDYNLSLVSSILVQN